jgi:hypothetical protein
MSYAKSNQYRRKLVDKLSMSGVRQSNKKKFRVRAAYLVAFVLGCSWLWLAPLVAQAHADRLVAGKYGFRVGFLDEPVYNSLPNGIDLSICQGACKVLQDGSGNYANPVEDTNVYETLQAEVIFGSSKLALKLTPVFRRPGKFSAAFMPMAIGDYTFHFFGTIGLDKIDENFNSAKDGFDAVQDVAALQFPKVAPSNTASPATSTTSATSSVAMTTADSMTTNTTPIRTTQTTPSNSAPTTMTAMSNMVDDSTQAQLQATTQQLQAARQEVAEAKNSASAATVFAIIGIVVGLLGLLFAVVAIVRSNKGGNSNIEAG